MQEHLQGFLVSRRSRRLLFGLAILFVFYRLYHNFGGNNKLATSPTVSIRDPNFAPMKTALTRQEEVAEAVPIPPAEPASTEKRGTGEFDQVVAEAPEEKAEPPTAEKEDDEEDMFFKRRWALEAQSGESAEALEIAIRNLVNSVPVVVFSKTTCPYSSSAKTILQALNLSPKPFIVEVDTRSDSAVVKSALISLTRHGTFPNIFLGGQHIGGADDLHKLASENKLIPLLNKAGAVINKPGA